MKQGDVFRWYFKDHDDYVQRNRSTAYWCMSRVCFADENLNLWDIYSGYFRFENELFIHFERSEFNKLVHPEKCDLEFLFNLNEVRKVREYEAPRYEQHWSITQQVTPMYFVPKDSEPSTALMIKQLEDEIATLESEISSKQYSIAWKKKEIEELKGNK
jgi:hypothetical protein